MPVRNNSTSCVQVFTWVDAFGKTSLGHQMTPTLISLALVAGAWYFNWVLGLFASAGEVVFLTVYFSGFVIVERQRQAKEREKEAFEKSERERQKQEIALEGREKLEKKVLGAQKALTEFEARWREMLPIRKAVAKSILFDDRDTKRQDFAAIVRFFDDLSKTQFVWRPDATRFYESFFEPLVWVTERIINDQPENPIHALRKIFPVGRINPDIYSVIERNRV